MRKIDHGHRLPCPKAKAPGAGNARGLQGANVSLHRNYDDMRSGLQALLKRLIKFAIVRLALAEAIPATAATRLIHVMGVAHV